jgi:hypothetical protein
MTAAPETDERSMAMKGCWTLTLAAVLLTLWGCEPQPDPADGRSEMNAWLVRSYSDEAIKNAIIAQHTLFPYHFAQNGAELNKLGQHDLGILAEHFKTFPGPLSIRQGGEGRALYRARINTVLKALAAAGVKARSVPITNQLPGGDGADSDTVIRTVIESDSRQGGSSNQSGGSGTSTGTGRQ